MNWDQIEGQWHQMTGQLKSKWAKLTDDDLKNVAGKRDQFLGKIQERYGIMKEDAEKQVNEWISSVATGAEKLAEKAAEKADAKLEAAKTQPMPMPAAKRA